ncbi:MAG: HD domain-containing phosphohydrolase, partial [Holophagaceae bacterium]
AATIALSHHEHWDGSGYPDGLKGEEIPLEARIVALVDVYDALTTHRPYRPALGEKEALTLIRNGVGTHFDPRVHQAFEVALVEIRRIQNQLQDSQPLRA